MKQTIIYYGNFGLPDTAAGIRVFQIGKILSEHDYNVIYVCNKEKKDNAQNSLFFFEGFQYNFVYKNKGRINNILEFILEKDFLDSLISICNKVKPTMLIGYNTSYKIQKSMLKYARINQIKIGIDVTEWYSIVLSRRFNKITALKVYRRIISADRQMDFIIAISPYLYKFYRARNEKVVFLPPLFNTLKDDSELFVNCPLHLVYAGKVERKDLLIPLLDVLKNINDKEIKIYIDIVGMDDEQLKEVWCVDGELKHIGINCYGWLDHEKTIEIVKKSDFGVLLRHPKLYARAGFSTKFSECMSHGVPMICNKLGGTETVIESGLDGFIINDLKYKTIYDFIQMLIELPESRVLEMKRCALKKAKEYFDINNYIRRRK